MAGALERLKPWRWPLGFLCLPALIVLWAATRGPGLGELFAIYVGDVWFDLHPGSLQLLEPAIARHISPALWQNVVQPFLLWPAMAVALIPSAIAAGIQAVRQLRAMNDQSAPD